MSAALLELARARRAGRAAGIYAVCSAHPLVIEAAMHQALEDGGPLLVESTSNQVDQFGGYTGMRPADFMGFVCGIAQRVGLDAGRLIFGGDHLGPNPWQDRPADEAMVLARDMISAYAAAGFTKLHLDTSMRCADDLAVLDDRVLAERAASLCTAAEAAAVGTRPVYVIGTEVPVPGGGDRVTGSRRGDHPGGRTSHRGRARRGVRSGGSARGLVACHCRGGAAGRGVRTTATWWTMRRPRPAPCPAC